MNPTEQDDDLDLDLDLEEEGGETQLATTPEAEAPELTEAEQLAALKAELAEIKARPAAPQTDFSGAAAQVAQAIREAAANASRPQPAAPDPEQRTKLNQQFQESLLTDPFETIRVLADQIAEQKINAMMANQGANALSVAGDTVVEQFLSRRGRDAGENGRKLHETVARALEAQITPQVRTQLAGATREQRQQFLEQQYKMAAGEVLLKSTSRGKPRDMSAGGGGGGPMRGASALPQFPGVSPREQRSLERLAVKLNMKPADVAKIAKDLAEGVA